MTLDEAGKKRIADTLCAQIAADERDLAKAQERVLILKERIRTRKENLAILTDDKHDGRGVFSGRRPGRWYGKLEFPERADLILRTLREKPYTLLELRRHFSDRDVDFGKDTLRRDLWRLRKTGQVQVLANGTWLFVQELPNEEYQRLLNIPHFKLEKPA